MQTGTATDASSFALWYPIDEDSIDILGAGESASEAIEAARAQVRIWESNSVSSVQQ